MKKELIYLSYNQPEDQVIALRAQTLAAVYGLKCYVPSADSRVREECDEKLQESAHVIGVCVMQPAAAAFSVEWPHHSVRVFADSGFIENWDVPAPLRALCYIIKGLLQLAALRGEAEGKHER